MTYIAMLSGGRDSTAMVTRLLENNMPLDYIVFCDTLHEFGDMYEYIDKFDEFIQRKYRMKITRLCPKDTFEDWVFGEITRGENKGVTRGLPKVLEPCYWRREAKVKPFEKWIKDAEIGDHKIYIGYTYSELDRAKVKQDNFLYPLIEWHWNEQMCQHYLSENQMENSLYQKFTRTGCAFCPKMSDDAYFNVWKHYKGTWEYMKNIEDTLNEAHNSRWHITKPLSELEKEFEAADRQGLLYEFDYEAPSDCFCKI